jgi:hypothetical protein
MKRVSKVILLIALFAFKIWMDEPGIGQSNCETGKHFEPIQWVEIIGDTGGFHVELKWNSENLSIKSIHPTKEKQKEENA